MPKKTLETVLDSGNHLLVQLKGNQPTLQAHARKLTAQSPTHIEHSHEVGRHSRIETRTVKRWPLPAGFGSEPWHSRFSTLVEVERRIERFDTRAGQWVPSHETALYLCDLPHDTAGMGDLIRRHWHIENRLHWVRDATLGEDRSRIRDNPGIFARLRSFTLNILRFNGEKNISQALYHNALDFDRVLNYQGI